MFYFSELFRKFSGIGIVPYEPQANVPFYRMNESLYTATGETLDIAISNISTSTKIKRI